MERLVRGLIMGVTALALLAALGCGSDGVSRAVHDQLRGDLDAALQEAEVARQQEREAEQQVEAAEQKVEEAEQQVEAAEQQVEEAQEQLRDELRARLAALRAQRQAEAGREQAEQQRDAAQEQIDEAEEEAAEAVASAREAQARAAETERTREASQRAQYLQAEMLSVAAPPPLGTNITMNAPSRGRLDVTRSGTSWRPVTLGGAGLRSATMPLTSNVNTGKTVVYTDRELNRPLMEHFGFLRDPNNLNLLEFTAGTLTFSTVDADGESTNGMVDTSAAGAATAWQLTHRIPKTVQQIPSPDTPGEFINPPGFDDNRMAASYPLSLFGMSGQLVCSGCEITLDPTYTADAGVGDAAVRGQHDLTSVAVSGNALRFDPSGSPIVHFYNGSDFLGDLEYMVFGYWREDPRSPASPYDSGAIGVFAKAFDGAGSQTLPTDINATYRGTAVGMYVEQELADPIDTHRQGEFVASAVLTVAGRNASISGTVRDFTVSPTGGSAMPHRSERWVVRLLDKSNADNDPAIVLNNESGSTVGGWAHEYVRAHEYAGRHSGHATNRDTPPAVTGTFNAKIGTISRTGQHVDDINQDALHIIGAFGAHQ